MTGSSESAHEGAAFFAFPCSLKENRLAKNERGPSNGWRGGKGEVQSWKGEEGEAEDHSMASEETWRVLCLSIDQLNH